MTPSEVIANEPEDAGTEYDLAGNPLPLKLKAAAVPPPGLHFAPSPNAVPSPNSYAPPSGGIPAVRPAAPAKSSPGLGLFLALGGGLLALTLVIFGLKALWPKPAVVPASFKTYTAIDSSFSCDQPAGWSLRETGATNGNLATVVFQSGPARVRVISDATGSVMGDIQGVGNANLPPAQQIPAVQKIHMMDEKQLAASQPGYDEGDAQPVSSASGDARVSEWTAGGGLRGYRVTMLGREREFTVICFCPERDWPALRPAFQRIIGSVKSGPPS